MDSNRLGSEAVFAAVSIDLRPARLIPQESGTWKATGAIDDSGSYLRIPVRATGSLPLADLSRHNATVRVFVLASSQGTLTVKAKGLEGPSGELVRPLSKGVWQIVAATGAYAGLSGYGTSEVLEAPVLNVSLIGVLSMKAASPEPALTGLR